jgi:ABC-type nickel/cobalt efflux system permease component RcnA
MILAIIAGAVVILLIIAGWCAWRFLKKKRPKGADEKVYALVIIEHVIKHYKKEHQYCACALCHDDDNLGR